MAESNGAVAETPFTWTTDMLLPPRLVVPVDPVTSRIQAVDGQLLAPLDIDNYQTVQNVSFVFHFVVPAQVLPSGASGFALNVTGPMGTLSSQTEQLFAEDTNITFTSNAFSLAPLPRPEQITFAILIVATRAGGSTEADKATTTVVWDTSMLMTHLTNISFTLLRMNELQPFTIGEYFGGARAFDLQVNVTNTGKTPITSVNISTRDTTGHDFWFGQSDFQQAVQTGQSALVLIPWKDTRFGPWTTDIRNAGMRPDNLTFHGTTNFEAGWTRDFAVLWDANDLPLTPLTITDVLMRSQDDGHLYSTDDVYAWPSNGDPPLDVEVKVSGMVHPEENIQIKVFARLTSVGTFSEIKTWNTTAALDGSITESVLIPYQQATWKYPFAQGGGTTIEYRVWASSSPGDGFDGTTYLWTMLVNVIPSPIPIDAMSVSIEAVNGTGGTLLAFALLCELVLSASSVRRSLSPQSAQLSWCCAAFPVSPRRTSRASTTKKYRKSSASGKRKLPRMRSKQPSPPSCLSLNAWKRSRIPSSTPPIRPTRRSPPR
jgi:hypothetical protein